MPFDLGRFAQGAGSGAAIGSAFGGIGAPIGAGIGALGSLFGESDKEIRQRQIREYLKRRAQLRDQSLARLSEETGKNIGRINQYTTGTLQRTQGDLAARSASRGRGADEADFLAAQGQITGQGSQAIQSTQDLADKYRRQIEDQYEQDVLNAEMEGLTYPESPNFTDVLGSIAPAALQYSFNQQYLDKAFPESNPSMNEIPSRPPEIVPTGINPMQIPNATSDRVTDVNKPDYNFMGEAENTNQNIPYIQRRGLYSKRRLPNTFYPSFAQ